MDHVFRGGLVGKDIAPLILLHIGAPKRLLLPIALSCKAFLEPALDILWHDMDNTAPLIRLFPLTKIDGRYRIRKSAVTAAALDRFKYYGQRVRRLSLTQENHIVGEIPLQVLTALAEVATSHTLFQSLGTLYFCLENETDKILQLFLNPSLRVIVLIGRATRSAVTQVALRSPNIERLELHEYSTPDVHTHYGPVLQDITNARFQSLSMLSIHGRNGNNLNLPPLDLHSTLSSLPSLKQLTIATFALEHAHMDLDWATPCQQIISCAYMLPSGAALQPNPFLLQMTTLDILVSPTHHNLQPFIGYVASSLRLRDLTVRGEPNAQSEEPIVGFNSLRPIFAATNLTNLHIRGIQLVHGDAAQPFGQKVASAIRLAESTSRLKALTLPSDIVPRPSITDLPILVQELPHLRTLGLGITSLAVIPEGQSLCPSSNQLRILTINDDRTAEDIAFEPEEYPALARYISGWFPNLEQVNSHTHERQWQLVNVIRTLLAGKPLADAYKTRLMLSLASLE
ncbi:hypothetical protein BKA70DRAFT_1430547 [Coprinopsis sp. MPI-PUGE-AT-0042]|nr:hypothetical protein BKA70DRAFT_1430547 [Coprinopsis sp. MPI-PUGE-AT-0042]